jgi:hypothetical protein
LEVGVINPLIRVGLIDEGPWHLGVDFCTSCR